MRGMTLTLLAVLLATVPVAAEDHPPVTVAKVNTQNRKGKPRRHRFRKGHTKDWKKAIVTLDSEDLINFF